MKQRTLSILLKVIIVFALLFGIAICFFLLPEIARETVEPYPELKNEYYAWLAFIWAASLPCFIALIPSWKIAGSICKDMVFTSKNARRLRSIYKLAAADTVFFFVGNLIMLLLDFSHPGILLFSLIIVFAGFAITIITAALAHLIDKGTIIREENDLTI